MTARPAIKVKSLFGDIKKPPVRRIEDDGPAIFLLFTLEKTENRVSLIGQSILQTTHRNLYRFSHASNDYRKSDRRQVGGPTVLALNGRETSPSIMGRR